MNIFKKKGVQIFLIGGVVGFLLPLIYDSISFIGPPLLGKILLFPVVMSGVLLGQEILRFACKFSEDPHWCMAGQLDGGPNDWLIYFCIYLVSVLFYGLVFWLLYRLIQYFRKRKAV